MRGRSSAGALLIMMFAVGTPAVGAPASTSSSRQAASPFALFRPDWNATPGGAQIREEIIERATKTLDRPPGAVPVLHTEGTLPGKGIRDASIAAKRDQLVVFDLALAWRLTGDRRFLAATSKYLEPWVDVYRISLNPIDETGFDTMVFATDLVRADMAPALRGKLERFWRQMSVGYLDAMDAGARNANTNWQGHRVKLATVTAFATGDPILIARARDAFQRHVALNILPDGTVRDFQIRDALHYVTYGLEPLLMSALVAKEHGEDWFTWESPTGSSLPKALKWLEAYASGKIEHMEFVRTTVRFDHERAAAGDPEYAPHLWKRGTAVRTYAMASICDPRYAKILSEIEVATDRHPSSWMRLFLMARLSAR